MSSALLVDDILSGYQWCRHCPCSRRLRLKVSFQVSRGTLSGRRSTVISVSYILLNFSYFWVRSTVPAYPLLQANCHLHPQIRVARWVTTKEASAKARLLLVGHPSIVEGSHLHQNQHIITCSEGSNLSRYEPTLPFTSFITFVPEALFPYW